MPILLKRKNGEITPFRNAEYISAFYFIPKSILDKCGEEINSIPRNPRKLLQDRRAIEIIESDLFKLVIIDAYAFMVWPFMGLGAKREIYSGYEPSWRYAHAASIWIKGMEDEGVIPKLQEILKSSNVDEDLGYISEEEISETFTWLVPKIRAVVCYKLDRIGRKTSDLLRLLDFLEKHKVDLLICSNNINTASGVSKIFIQIFAVVAEFERDTLTERITDNMMELAKDGRWLGGNTPTGFTVKRVKTGSGKNKSAYSYLESIPEEKAMIQKLYAVFSETRSIKKIADRMNELGYRTKIGSKFNTSTTRLLLKNPVYCVADEIAYNYFYENGGGVCADLSEFDGQHGLSAYNKTDQEKFEDADSTFISPKFIQLMSAKPVSEWIISVGRHEGFIPSQQWIDTQNMLDSIAEKYNRPHRKTNALLAGLVYCPHCGKRLRVISESNRWTNGKPRFKYVCPGYRLGECTFRAVDGVLLDEFVVKQLSNLSDEDSEYFVKLLNQKASDIFKNTQNEQELIELKKKKHSLKQLFRIR